MGYNGASWDRLRSDTTNGLDVDVTRLPSIPAGNNNIGDVDIVSGTVTTVTSLTQMNGQAISMGTGVRDAGTQRVTIATNDAVPVTDNAGSLTVDAPVATPVFVRLSDGAAAISALPVTDNASSISVDWNGTQPVTGSGNATGALRVELPNNGTGLVGLNAGSNLIGQVSLQTNTGTGWTNFNATSGDGSTALTNTAQAVKASAGKVGGWFIYNPNSTVAYVCIYNVAAASVTVGTTNPLMVLPVPPLTAANLEMVHGINFSTAISCAATSTANGNGAPTTALDVNLFYN
jgi:hypothetical protein